MSISTLHIGFAFGISGLLGTLLMSNIMNQVQKSKCDYKACKRHWNKTQKYKMINLQVKLIKAKRNFFDCIAGRFERKPDLILASTTNY